MSSYTPLQRGIKATLAILVCTLLALGFPLPAHQQSVQSSGVTIEDIFGRALNDQGITLVDWEGHLANPAIKLNLRPPADAGFPGNATITANGVRLYFDLPSTVGAVGPSKVVTFAGASTLVPVYLSVFPDRNPLDEDYVLTVTFTDAANQTTITNANIHVIDQDKAEAALFPLNIDFSKDQTGFFDDPATRAIVQQAGADWFYFFDDMHLDQVPAGAETTWIWDPDGFNSGHYTTNANSYTGFLLYAYGIHSDALRSGGEGSGAGGFQSSGGVPFQIRRSGGLEIETEGNYNSLGWFLTAGDDDWWHTGNLGNELADLYSIAHHEMGHAFAFNGAYPVFAQAKSQGQLQDAAISAYQNAGLAVDASDHFTGMVDRLSRRGAFGWEYYGDMPQRRWLITKLDLLAAQAVGYHLRETSAFAPFTVTTTDLQPGQRSTPYAGSIGVSGGIPFYYFAIESGSLPDGLALDSFSGAISGTPTAAGTFNFSVRARDYDDASPGVVTPLSLTIENTGYPVTGLQASVAASNPRQLKLDWTAVALNAGGDTAMGITYNVYRAQDAPYFVPGEASVTDLTDPTWTDPDTAVLTSPLHSTYYVVQAVHDGLGGAPSNAVGAFVFGLAAGG